MKMAAIKYLKNNDFQSYDFGISTFNSSIQRIASEKQKGITVFKSGFSAEIKPMFICEKFYDSDYFEKKYSIRIRDLKNDFFDKAVIQ